MENAKVKNQEGQNEWKELPNELKKKMDLWRMDLICLPDEYIQFHKELAEEKLEELKVEKGIKVRGTWMENDGWMDSMKVLHAVVETRKGYLRKLKWHDGRRQQEFFVCNQGCGGSGIIINELD